MKQKQLLFVLLSLQVITLMPVDDHFISTTGDVVIESKNNDIAILADTNGSTGKVNFQVGTTTASTTTAGDIGLSATNELILKATKIKLDTPVAEGIEFDTVYTSAITTSTEFPGGTVSEDLIVHNDITFDANLTITGNLIVRGGSVIINGGVNVMVTGNILFDGLQTAGKYVNITGNIYGATSSDPGCQKLTVRNYKPGIDIDPISISGTVTTNDNILITNNEASGASRSGLVLSGTISAYETMTYSHNVGSGRYGVDVSGVLESFTEDIIFTGNISGGIYHGIACRNNSVTAFRHVILSSNSTAGTGNGVSIESSCTVTAGLDVRIVDNVGDGGAARGLNVQIAGTTITAGRDIYLKGNINNNPSGAKINIWAGTSLTAAHQVVFDEAITLSSTELIKAGAINGEVIFNGGLIASAATTFEENVTVNGVTTVNENLTCNNCLVKGSLTVAANKTLTVENDLTVLGGSVTVNGGATVTVSGDILFDGKEIAPTKVIIQGFVTADSSIIQNYINSDYEIGCAVKIDLNSYIITNNDMIFRNNHRTGTFVDGANLGEAICIFNDNTMISWRGDILFVDNSSSMFPGITCDKYLQANKIIFTENTSTYIPAVGGYAHGVNMSGTKTYIGRSEIRFEKNSASSTLAFGSNIDGTYEGLDFYIHHDSSVAGTRTATTITPTFNSHYTSSATTVYVRDQPW